MHDVCAHSKIRTMEMNLFIKGHGEKAILLHSILLVDSADFSKK